MKTKIEKVIVIKRIICIMCALVLMLGIVGCSGEPVRLNVGYDPDMIALLEGGKNADAFADELAVAIAERLGGEPASLRELDSQEAARLFESGELDIYIGLEDSCPQGAWCSEPLAGIDTLAVESGKVTAQEITGRSAVAVVGSSAFEAACESERYMLIAQVMLCADAQSALGEISSGSAELALLDEVNARALTEVSGYEYTIHSQPVYSAQLVVMLPAQSRYERGVSKAVKWLSRRDRLADISISTLGADITL